MVQTTAQQGPCPSQSQREGCRACPRCWVVLALHQCGKKGRRSTPEDQDTVWSYLLSLSSRYLPVAFYLRTLITPNPLTMSLCLTPLPDKEIKNIL